MGEAEDRDEIVESQLKGACTLIKLKGVVGYGLAQGYYLQTDRKGGKGRVNIPSICSIEWSV